MRKKIPLITLEKARHFCLQRQLLTQHRKLQGKQGTLAAIKQLGYIQIDTINVIDRSHHITLFTRCSDYQHEFLHSLQAKDKKIFEYWAHAASYIPMEDYRYYLIIMKKKPKDGSWLSKWTRKHHALLGKVKQRIVKEGPLAASDFKDVEKRKRGPWWDWKPAKAALEILFWRGELMIKERRNFQRVYDLTERVLPSGLDTRQPSEDENKMFFIKRALQSMGIATMQDINRYVNSGGKLNKWLNPTIENGVAQEVQIKGVKNPYYIMTDELKNITSQKSKFSNEVKFLSPFDNSIILRDRVQALFDFKYSLECYVSKQKRKYGYYCLPILWRNNLVGRIDPKADRPNNTLIINSLYIEKKNIDLDRFLKLFAQSLWDFAHFHRCENIKVNKIIPSKYKKNIIKII